MALFAGGRDHDANEGRARINFPAVLAVSRVSRAPIFSLESSIPSIGDLFNTNEIRNISHREVELSDATFFFTKQSNCLTQCSSVHWSAKYFHFRRENGPFDEVSINVLIGIYYSPASLRTLFMETLVPYERSASGPVATFLDSGSIKISLPPADRPPGRRG